MNAKILVHLRRNERKRGSKQRAEHAIGSEDAGCIDSVGINEIIHDPQEYQNHTKAEKGCEKYTHYPVYVGRVGPSKDE